MQTSRTALAAAMMIVAVASGVHAADIASPPPPPPGQAPDQGDQATPDEIVVTGEKSNSSIQKTQASVRVFTAKDIERENLLSVYDAIDRTANVTSTFARSGFTIRGIANSNVTGVGTGDLATVYLDDSPLPRDALSGPLDLWDVSQVEILRGPQSTLQGRNALAGAIVIRTADPTYDWQGKARIILTDKDADRRFAAAVGGPIVADQIAFRIAGEHDRAAGFITNTTLGTDRAGFRKGDNIRAKLLVTPTAAPDLRIVASYMHDKHSSGIAYVNDYGPGTWSHRTTQGNRPTLSPGTTSDIATLDTSYVLGHGLTLSSVTTWARIRDNTHYDGDNQAVDEAYGDYSTDQTTVTEEVRLNLSSGPVQGLIGGYFSHLSDKQDRSHSVFSLSPVDDLGLPAAISGIYPDRLYIDTRQFYPQTVRNLALFGDGSWQVAPRLKLRAGFRYDVERDVRANDNTVGLITQLPDPADYGALGPTIDYINGLIMDQVSAANSSSPAATTTFKAFLPKAGITYDLTDDASIAATVQRGYRSGGSGVNPGRGALYTYKPEYTWNYELALRTLWLDRRLSVNANAFYIDWKQQQVNVQLSPNIYDYETVNAGKSRVWGGEIETRFQPSREWSFYGSAGYSNTKFLDFKPTAGIVDDLTGHQFANAPHWTLAAGGTWESDRGWFVNLNANWRSGAYQEVGDQSHRQLKAHALVNSKAGWRNSHFGIYATVTNLFDTHYFDYSYLNGATQNTQFGDPRVLGLTLEAGF
jgi:outer membrane receptor protein involved in Fe transport